MEIVKEERFLRFGRSDRSILAAKNVQASKVRASVDLAVEDGGYQADFFDQDG